MLIADKGHEEKALEMTGDARFQKGPAKRRCTYPFLCSCVHVQDDFLLAKAAREALKK